MDKTYFLGCIYKYKDRLRGLLGFYFGFGLFFPLKVSLNCKSCGSLKKSKHMVKNQPSYLKLQYKLYVFSFFCLVPFAFHPNDLQVPHVYIVSIKPQLLFMSTK